MNEYKKHTINLGSSDMAMLHYVGYDVWNETIVTGIIDMGGDGSYNGYIVKENGVVIPDHYELDKELKMMAWLNIYDDTSLVCSIDSTLLLGDGYHDSRTIRIYRAGNYTLLIDCVESLTESMKEEIDLYRNAWESAKINGKNLVDYNEGYFMTGSWLNNEYECSKYNPESIYWSETGEEDSTIIEFKTWEEFYDQYMEGKN